MYLQWNEYLRRDEYRRYFPDWTRRSLAVGEEVEADHNSYLAGGYAEEFGYLARPGCPVCAYPPATPPPVPVNLEQSDADLVRRIATGDDRAAEGEFFVGWRPTFGSAACGTAPEARTWRTGRRLTSILPRRATFAGGTRMGARMS